MKISAIIPTWCEAESVERAVECARAIADEVLVVDANSSDDTADRARSAGAIVISSDKGRGVQLDVGAENARGDVLLFLHADAHLPATARAAIEGALEDDEVLGGNFHLRFVPETPWARVFSRINDWRRRLLRIYYGDSALFVRRDAYEELGGFRALPIMEDYDLVRRLERLGRTAYIRHVDVEVSARRFVASPLKTLAVWSIVQVLFSSGVSAAHLSRLYADIR